MSGDNDVDHCYKNSYTMYCKVVKYSCWVLHVPEKVYGSQAVR